jgi:hypothetical protein
MQPKPDDPEPVSYFQLEQRRRANPGETKANTAISQLPSMPAASPWSADPVPPEEPIDRREDGDFIQSTEGDE